MVKIIKKYMKTILSSALIFCLIIPSYASLTLTDGSTFVTKAEFDSAFSEFNSTLTKFESSVNSKIDSQVTSYLDKNGIWSGKEQTLVNPINTKVDMNVKCIKIISNISKTGLLYLPWSFDIDLNAGLYASNNGGKSGDSLTRGQGSPINMDYYTDIYLYDMPKSYNEDSYTYDATIFDSNLVTAISDTLNLVGEWDTVNDLLFAQKLNREKNRVLMFFVNDETNLYIRCTQTAQFLMDWYGVKGSKTNEFITSDLTNEYSSGPSIKFMTNSGWKFQWHIWEEPKIY